MFQTVVYRVNLFQLYEDCSVVERQRFGQIKGFLRDSQQTLELRRAVSCLFLKNICGDIGGGLCTRNDNIRALAFTGDMLLC